MEQDDFKTVLEEKEKEIQDLKAKLATAESEKATLLQHMTHLSSKWKEDTSEIDKLLSTMESSTGLDGKTRPVIRRQQSMGVPPIMGEESPDIPFTSPVVPELRIVLLGGTCVDKQAVTEAILGRESGAQVTTATQTQCSDSRQEEVQETILGSDTGIATQASRSTQTQCCECSQGEVAGRMVRVVKTPDWFSPQFVDMQDVRRCMSLSNPGPHVFIIILPVKSIGGEERNIEDKLEEMFGETCWSHTMVLLTSSEEVKQTSVEELVQRGNQELSQLFERCGNRCHLLSLKTCAADASLLAKIEGVMTNNIDEFYCSQRYLNVEESLRDMEILMQREKEQRKERKQSIKKEKEDQFKRMLQESLSKVERDISKHESDMKTISERLSVLEGSRKEEQNERKVKETEKKLKKVEKRIKELKEKWEKERMKMEERHKKDIEEIQDEYKKEAKVETERHLRKLLLSGFHKTINSTKPMIQENLSAVTKGMHAHMVKQMHKDSSQGQSKNKNSDKERNTQSEE